MFSSRFFVLFSVLFVAYAVPPGFPANGNGIWYTSQGANWVTSYVPVGNGYLGATTPGGTSLEATSLNIESLWSGGPFQDPAYNGGNKQPSDQAAMTAALQNIRDTIFAAGTIDNVEILSTPAGAYGSYAAAGYLVNQIDVSGTITDYYRWLDMDQGVARTLWTQNNYTFFRELFCSYPTKACVQHLSSSSTLPSTNYTFSQYYEVGLPSITVTCVKANTLQVRGSAGNPGMIWEILASVQAVGTGASVTCNTINSTTSVVTVEGASEAWITWVGDTEYSMDAGNAAFGYSFKGPDPHDVLTTLVGTVSLKTYSELVNQHETDYSSVLSLFSLDLGQQPNLNQPTDTIMNNYQTDIGDAYLEWLLFNFGRHLLLGSARGKLPANLQGVWASDAANPWSADYHSNINLQMNYWFPELTDMDVTQPLWDYMEKTWAPRGTYTAQVLYNNSRGWVTHNEMNIFGHTGMKLAGNSAQWADYPASNAWMALHIWDHFDFTNDVAWWKTQGYPLLKGIALFHLDSLIPDLRSNDMEFTVAPCNSPEQVPITYGCAHFQQLIWQVFNSVEKGFAAAGDTDTSFLEAVIAKRQVMDKGVRIGWWGEIMEWKEGLDSSTDTHRHLSHLIGLYPGYALLTYDPSLQPAHVNGSYMNYTRHEILEAAKVSLIHRGDGNGPDADAGWEKVWRAAGWASLGSPVEFYHELSYSIFENFAGNLFSVYGKKSTPNAIFQIDANFGYPAALLNGLIQVPDTPSLNSALVVTLLPALPPGRWSTGSIKGARIRSGLLLDFSWDQGKLTAVTVRPSRGSSAVWTSSGSRGRQVVLVNGQTRQIIQSFWTGDIHSQLAIPVSLVPCDGLQGECVFS